MMRDAGGRAKPLILVVDDDPTERFLHRQTLEKAGFEVTEAANGAMALAVFANERPDIVMLDVVMPEMHGFDVCEAIRDMPEGRDTPILMATSLDDVASIDRAYRAGATDFVGKPINWGVLPHHVRYMLRADQNIRRLIVSERRLGEAQRIAGLGSFCWRPGDPAVECSQEVLRIFGIDGNAAPSARALLRRIPSEERAGLFRALREAFHGSPVALDHCVTASDGTVRTVCLRVEFAGGPGEAKSLHGSCQDITERKHFEKELEVARDEALAASAAKTAFLAAMSHELRTPLNAIIGFSELIADQAFGPSPSKYIEFARNIHNAGERVLGVFDDVLTIAELEAGRFELRRDSVDLHQLAEAVLAEFCRSELGRGRQVSLEAEGEGCSVAADRRAVRQMILKLLSNAAKFSAPGTMIHLVCARSDDGWPRISVVDQGIGMTPREAELALRSFTQIDSRLARQYDGAGLGLSIVNKLIECHGGRATIVSEPAKGTCVSLDFPPAADLGERARSTARDPARGWAERLLGVG
jgi:signal transduction histidine kinase